MNFIPYGASVSNLFINDTRGIERDVVLGFDNATAYTLDTAHPHLGGVPGMSSRDYISSTNNQLTTS
jgi:aldose 1-epimerase